jgi:outer membrane autotransporter protein
LNALGINVDPSQRGLFIQQYGGMLTERTQDNVSLRYDHTTAGYLIGFDTEVSPSALVGGAIGYSYTGLNMNEFGDNTGTKGYQASLYGTYTQGPFYLNGILGYGYNYYDTKREIVLPGFNNAAKASYEGHLMSGHVEVGYKIPVSFLDINPLAGIKHSYFMRDGFTESGADLISLIVGKQEYSSLISSLGVRLKKTIDMSQTQSITSEIRFHWDRELFNNDYGTNVSLSGFTGSSFKLTNKRPDRNMFVTGISLISQQTENLSFYISCDSSFSSGEPLHTGTLELRYRW